MRRSSGRRVEPKVAQREKHGKSKRWLFIRGKLASVKGQELAIATPNGEVRVKAPETTVIQGKIGIKFSEITSGMFLGTTAEKQSDGTFRASEIHEFSENQCGTGEGHRPSSSVANSTMTDANVEKVEDVAVRDVRGRMMTLKYKREKLRLSCRPTFRS